MAFHRQGNIDFTVQNINHATGGANIHTHLQTNIWFRGSFFKVLRDMPLFGDCMLYKHFHSEHMEVEAPVAESLVNAVAFIGLQGLCSSFLVPGFRRHR